MAASCPSCGHANRGAKFCDQCGTQLPVRVSCGGCGHANVDAKFCERCGKALTGVVSLNPYAPPADTADDRPGDGEQLPLASRGARLGAVLIDAFCVSVVNVPLLFAFGLGRLDGRMSWSETAIAVGLGFVVFLLLQVWTLPDGQTIGKRALGLRMVDIDSGHPPPASRLIARRYLPLSVVALLGPLGSLLSIVDALFIFGGDRRCLHDRLAGTRVVRDPDRDS